MKYIFLKQKIFAVLVLCFFLGFPLISSAQFYKPFGGRIITAPTPGVECPAGKQPSPFTLWNLATMTPTLMVGDQNSKSFGQIMPSAWILGLYIPILVSECQTTSTPSAPVPGYRTYLHGTSMGGTD